MTHEVPDAFVLRNYHCDASTSVARYLTRAFFVSEFGHFRIDYNDPQFLDVNPYRSRSGAWWNAVEAKVHSVPHVIAIVSPELATVRPDTDTGVGLLTELLGFWERPKAPFGSPEKLLPILVDCSLDDLVVPRGGYEQLQDIVVPLLRRLRPIYLESTALVHDLPATLNFVNSVATRLNLTRLAPGC